MADDLASRSLLVIIIEVSTLVFLNLASFVGNVLVCVSVYRITELRTSNNLYIIALAISDLLSAVLVMPFSIGALITGRWIFGSTVCHVQGFFVQFVLYVSPVTMGLTAVNRYVRICRSDALYRRYFSPIRSRLWLSLVWILVASFVLFSHLAGFQEFDFIPGYGVCVNIPLSATGWTVHFCLVVVLFLVAPLSLTVFSYPTVAKKIKTHSRGALSAFRKQDGNSIISVREIKLSKSLFVVVFAFMVCWFPLWIIAIIERFNLTALPRNFELLPAYCIFFSNAVNPVIYAGMNPLFKREFIRLLRCKKGGRVTDGSVPISHEAREQFTNTLQRDPRRQQQESCSHVASSV